MLNSLQIQKNSVSCVVFFNNIYFRAMFPYRHYFLPLVLGLFLGIEVSAQQAPPPPLYTIYDSMPQLEDRIKKSENFTLVIKFWATWCKPCVEELPIFEQLNERYAEKNVKVLLVSLDFKSQLQKRFLPFLETTKLQSEVILFADQDANTWIPKVNEDWDGAIPATFIVRGDKHNFHQGRFKDFTDLEAFMKPFLKGLDAASAATGR